MSIGLYSRVKSPNHQITSNPLPPDYIGCFYRGSAVVRNESSKWFEMWDNRVFLGQHYPTYANGAAYVLSY